MGWVVHRHGALYAEEYGWDERFEALVADDRRQVHRQLRPEARALLDRRARGRDRRLGVPGDEVADGRASSGSCRRAAARGLGIGKRLVDECVRFARQTGYRQILLWTNSVLHAARHIYEGGGLSAHRGEAAYSFGDGLVGQTWELKL